MAFLTSASTSLLFLQDHLLVQESRPASWRTFEAVVPEATFLASHLVIPISPSAMPKPWGGLGGAGAWALDAKRAEEEEPRRGRSAGGGKSKEKNKGPRDPLAFDGAGRRA
nr:unnamed protein product [Digitaria exilis]